MPDDTDAQLSMICPACRSKIAVPSGKEGEGGRCPVCDALITYPHRGTEKVMVRCQACRAKLRVERRRLGTQITCPHCRKPTMARLPDEADGMSVEQLEEARVRRLRRRERRSKLAWEEMERRKKDSYYKALARAFLYPIDALGLIVFFVFGVPLVVNIIQEAGDYVLRIAGPPGEGGTNYVAAVVVLATLVCFTFVAGVLATFVFAIIRVGAVGSHSVPVVQGEPYRRNLGAFALWFFAYLGPGLFVGFAGSGAELWQLNGWAVVFFALLGPLAPAALLFVVLASPEKAFSLGGIFRLIGRTFADYLYLLLMGAVSAVVFFVLGEWFSGAAARAAAGEEGSPVLAFFLRLGAGCLYMFPIVIFTRQAGLFVHYHRRAFPYRVDIEHRTTYSLLAEVVLFVGLVALYLPLNAHAQTQSVRGGKLQECAAHLEYMSEGIWRQRRHRRRPRTERELVQRFGSLARCPFVEARLAAEGEARDAPPADAQGEEEGAPPAAPEAEPARAEGRCDYVVERLPDDPDDNLMYVYDKEGNHPDGSRNVLFVAGKVGRFSPSRFAELKKLQDQILADPDDPENIQRLRRMKVIRVVNIP